MKTDTLRLAAVAFGVPAHQITRDDEATARALVAIWDRDNLTLEDIEKRHVSRYHYGQILDLAGVAERRVTLVRREPVLAGR